MLGMMYSTQHRIKTHCISLAAFAWSVALAVPAAAQVSSLIFERADIRIEAPLIKAEEQAAGPSRAPVALSIEMRPEESLRLEYIHTLNTLTPDGGVMIVLNSPAVLALPAMKVYTPVDAMFIAADGTITQILPNVVLGDMTQDVRARRPVQALLFLKAGTAAARSIHPRDVVIGKMFTPTPAMQE